MRTPRGKRDGRRTYLLSRTIIVCVVAGALGTLLWSPSGPLAYLADVTLRAYLVFLGTVMAHEGVHGHLGRTKRANFGWGRLALLPSLVPFVNFRKTHHLHHAHTNEPDRDPDHFLKPRHPLEIPLRAVAISHQWYFWVRRRGLVDGRHHRELALDYGAMVVVFGALAVVAGPGRVLWGTLPALVLVSIVLWYPFAIKTHEGYSTGPAATRSHDYYGRLMYWLSLGLSMHRVHHQRPYLSWLELDAFVRSSSRRGWAGLIPRRDIRLETEGVGCDAGPAAGPAVSKDCAPDIRCGKLVERSAAATASRSLA